MIRVVCMRNKWYGKKLYKLDDEALEDIENFIESGEPVILCNSLDELEDIGVDIAEIEMV